MNRKRAIKLICEGLELAKTVPVEQKIHLLNMVRECYDKMISRKSINSINLETKIKNNLDYIDEK
jgi:hypothetical protein